MRRRLFVVCLTLSAVLMGNAMVASGQTPKYLPDRKHSLRGLPGLLVVVEALSDNAERDGLSPTDIQTDVELQLRLAGIRVLSKDERLRHPATPYAYVNVNTLKREDGLYAYSIEVQVKQKVRLASGDFIDAATWDVGGVGTIGSMRLRQIREYVKDPVNELINDWLAVNPKK